MEEARQWRRNFSGSVSFLIILVISSSTQLRKADSIVDIPVKFTGFPYKHHPASSSAVVIEAFFDPVCPYSRDSWPPLKRALHHYGHHVALTVHPFPLPYHDNAFITSLALHIVDGINKSATYHLLEQLFLHQEKFYGSNTRNKTRKAITEELVEFVSDAVDKSYHSAVKSGFNDTSADQLTRVSFKYSCSRGVTGTPTFIINGFPLVTDDDIDYKGWRKVLGPLIKRHHS